MKIKILVFLPFLALISSSVFANPLRDSIGVENQDGKKVILHKLDPKDNYFSLGRKYNVSPKTIMKYNNNAALIIGNVVKVPTDRPTIETTAANNAAAAAPKPPYHPSVPQVTKPQPQNDNTNTTASNNRPAVATSNTAPVQEYKVSAGETLYSIAKRFGTTVEDITATNNLSSTSLHPGQTLKIKAGGSQPVAPAPAAAPVDTQNKVVAKRDNTANPTVVAPTDSSNANRFNANKFGLYEKDEKGVATWMDDADLDPNKKLVLHRTAPIGTVMKITNPMTNLTTYAKVVGRFTDNEATKDVIIVMTKNVADSLGALDKRFHVNISYGSPNE